MTGEKLAKFNLKNKNKNMFAVKEAVFPFNKFPNVDVLLGPEMKSTGEVMGIDKDFGLAYAKSQIASQNSLPTKGLAFISLKDRHKRIFRFRCSSDIFRNTSRKTYSKKRRRNSGRGCLDFQRNPHYPQ